jgi:hypothetical protein
MSYSITINNLPDFPEDGLQQFIEDMLRVNVHYPTDIAVALNAARSMGMSSCTLVAARTPNPYGDDEVVALSVLGMGRALDFNEAMKRNVAAGPDVPGAVPSDEETRNLYMEHLHRVTDDADDE